MAPAHHAYSHPCPRRAARPRAVTSHGSPNLTNPAFTASMKSKASGLGPTKPGASSFAPFPPFFFPPFVAFQATAVYPADFAVLHPARLFGFNFLFARAFRMYLFFLYTPFFPRRLFFLRLLLDLLVLCFGEHARWRSAFADLFLGADGAGRFARYSTGLLVFCVGASAEAVLVFGLRGCASRLAAATPGDDAEHGDEQRECREMLHELLTVSARLLGRLRLNVR